MIRSLLRTSWLIHLLLLGVILVSASFTLRFYRDEKGKVSRLQHTLQEIQAIRSSLEVDGVEGIDMENPLLGIAPDFLDLLTSNAAIESKNVGAGWNRFTSSYSMSSLPPDQLGLLLEVLQVQDRGWWVTGLTLEIREDGLAGQLRLEALDKDPLED